VVFLLVLICTLEMGARVGNDMWLSWWSDKSSNGTAKDFPIGFYLGVYCSLGVLVSAFTLVKSVVLYP
jgi:hypothetical protein